jgi:putative transposase
MSGAEEDRKRAARAEQVALFRYQLIREAADPSLSTRQRGRLVRELAAKAHPGPFGDPVTVSRETVDRWIRAWRAGGFAALAPPARQVTPRTDAAVLELAAGPFLQPQRYFAAEREKGPGNPISIVSAD